MKSRMRTLVCLTLIIWMPILVGLLGCRSANKNLGVCTTESCGDNSVLGPVNRIEYADIDRAVGLRQEDIAPPLTSATELPTETYSLTLDQTLQLALENTKLLRDLGGRVLQNPEFVPGVFDPAIQSTDPNFGVEAALSAFDAQFSSGLTYANNDDVFNNQVIGGGANEVQQNLTTGTFGLSKIAATGTLFSINGNVTNDLNDRPGNLFDNSWTTLFEAQMRQPLLQGRGLEFNRIAGPSGQPGLRGSNGVLISRINNDISIAQLERNVTSYVNDVITSYWQLYFAYRNFEATKTARDGAQDTWNTVKARFENDLPGGEADREAQAREQFFVFQGQLIAALNGDSLNGSTGILQAEADLRRLIGLPQNDGRLIEPIDEPVIAEIAFDWYELAQHAIDSRVELREQEWRVKRRELEMIAARHFTMPRLDAVATYRNNGFGDNLWGSDGQFSGAINEASRGDYDEWEFGLQMNVPIGLRQASAGVRNAQLLLERERQVLAEQQKQVVHSLGSAVRQIDQAYASVQVARSRLSAARDTVDARKAAFEAEAAPFDELLDAQQRLADAEIAYHRETVRWMNASELVALEAGNLLVNHQVHFNEGGSCNAGGVDVCERTSEINRLNQMDYRVKAPGYVATRGR